MAQRREPIHEGENTQRISMWASCRADALMDAAAHPGYRSSCAKVPVVELGLIPVDRLDRQRHGLARA